LRGGWFRRSRVICLFYNHRRRLRLGGFDAGVIAQEVGDVIALDGDRSFPGVAAVLGLVVPLEEVTEEDAQPVDQFFSFLASHCFDFFGEVFPVEVLGVVAA